MRSPIKTSCAIASISLLAACGGGDANNDAASPSGNADIVVEARNLDFDANSYSAKQGKVAIEYLQKNSLPHTLVIEGKSNFKLSVNGQKTDKGEILLEAGDYKLFCDIPGHRDAGMEATLTIK